MKALPVILALLLYLGGNFYVFFRLWQHIPCHAPLFRYAFIAGALLLATSMILSFIFSGILPAPLAGLLYAIGSTWIFVFLYLLLATLARDLLHWLDFLPLRGRALYYTLTGLAVVVLLAGHVCYLVKQRVEFTVDTGKLRGREYTLVLVSDLHLGHAIGNRELDRWVDLINAEHPDAILIAGDVIDNDVRPLDESRAHERLLRLRAPLGVYACLGNHEYIAGVDRSLRFLSRAGIHVLRDAVIEIDSAFYLLGRDDRQNRHRSPLSSLASALDPSKPLILLDHQPAHLDEAVASSVDLQLSGHTHEGQVWPISLLTRYLFELSHGHLHRPPTHFYVTSGIGLWGGKFRVATRSEYVIIHLR